MEQLQTMERGSLQAESRSSKQDPDLANGPYFKHQVWEDGKNQTRRVPWEVADRLLQPIWPAAQFGLLLSGGAPPRHGP